MVEDTKRFFKLIFFIKLIREKGLDYRVGHYGVLHTTVESMGGSAHTP